MRERVVEAYYFILWLLPITFLLDIMAKQASPLSITTQILFCLLLVVGGRWVNFAITVSVCLLWQLLMMIGWLVLGVSLLCIIYLCAA